MKETFKKGIKGEIGTVYKPIDLLILDFQMPIKNGLQVVSEIKNFYQAQDMHDYIL